MSTTKELELKKNLKDHTLTKLKPSIAVPGEIGVFALEDIMADKDPFEVCNAEPMETIALRKQWIDRLSTQKPQVADMIQKFVLCSEDSNGDTVYNIPATGMNSLDISFFLNTNPEKDRCNCKTLESEDGRGFDKILTSRSIKKGEELLLHYEIKTKYECVVCYSRLTENEKKFNVLQCGCTMNTRCRICIDKTILPRVDQSINTRTQKAEDLRATCDICQRPVSKDYLKGLLEPRTNPLPVTRSMSSREERDRNRPDELPKKAFAWMAEDEKWCEVTVTNYEDAETRTRKEHRVGGPVRRRGQFKYWFYTTGKGQKRKVEDYFSEDDDSVRFTVEEDADVAEELMPSCRNETSTRQRTNHCVKTKRVNKSMC